MEQMEHSIDTVYFSGMKEMQNVIFFFSATILLIHHKAVDTVRGLF